MPAPASLTVPAAPAFADSSDSLFESSDSLSEGGGVTNEFGRCRGASWLEHEAEDEGAEARNFGALRGCGDGYAVPAAAARAPEHAFADSSDSLLDGGGDTSAFTSLRGPSRLEQEAEEDGAGIGSWWWGGARCSAVENDESAAPVDAVSDWQSSMKASRS